MVAKIKAVIFQGFLVFVLPLQAKLPEKVTGVEVNTDDIFGTGFGLFQVGVNYATWVIGVAVVVVAAYNIIGALLSSRKGKDDGELSTAITRGVISLVVVFVLIIVARAVVLD